jgi:hypothetical protein
VLPDLLALGSTLQIAGGLLLAVAMLARSSRQLVAERLAPRGTRLVGLREAIVLRVQVGAGFLNIVAGFGCEWLGRSLGPAEQELSMYIWLPLLVVLELGLLVAGWMHASAACRRHLREQLQQAPPDLVAEAELTRELGELWDVDSTPEDTRESYAERVRVAVGLSVPRRRDAYAATQRTFDDSDF